MPSVVSVEGIGDADVYTAQGTRYGRHAGLEVLKAAVSCNPQLVFHCVELLVTSYLPDGAKAVRDAGGDDDDVARFLKAAGRAAIAVIDGAALEPDAIQ